MLIGNAYFCVLVGDNRFQKLRHTGPGFGGAALNGGCIKAQVFFDLGGDFLGRIPTLEPLRGSKAHVGALLDSVDSAVELVEQLTN